MTKTPRSLETLLTPSVRALFRQHARELFDEERFADALVLLSVLVEHAPDDATLHGWHALACLRAGDAATAVIGFQRAVALAPAQMAYAARLGEALVACGRHDEAASVLEALLDGDPDVTRAETAWVRRYLGELARRLRAG